MKVRLRIVGEGELTEKIVEVPQETDAIVVTVTGKPNWTGTVHINANVKFETK